MRRRVPNAKHWVVKQEGCEATVSPMDHQQRGCECILFLFRDLKWNGLETREGAKCPYPQWSTIETVWFIWCIFIIQFFIWCKENIYIKLLKKISKSDIILANLINGSLYTGWEEGVTFDREPDLDNANVGMPDT